MLDDGSTKDDVKNPDNEIGEGIYQNFKVDEKDTSKFASVKVAIHVLIASQTLSSSLLWARRPPSNGSRPRLLLVGRPGYWPRSWWSVYALEKDTNKKSAWIRRTTTTCSAFLSAILAPLLTASTVCGSSDGLGFLALPLSCIRGSPDPDLSLTLDFPKWQ
jgi:hypothetical protein